jgi:hypothetical protein
MKTTPVCSFCGKQWPKFNGYAKDWPDDVAKEVREHIESCDKNPLVIEIKRLSVLVQKAYQLADIAIDWNFDEVEIDGVMINTRELREEFKQGGE